MKSPTSFRLSNEAKQIIKDLAKTKGISQNAVIEIAVRDMAKREGIK